MKRAEGGMLEAGEWGMVSQAGDSAEMGTEGSRREDPEEARV